MQEPLAGAVGLLALVASGFYFLSDVSEAVQGGFSGPQLWLTLLAEAAVPVFVLGLLIVQRPLLGRLGALGAVAYAYSYVFFTGTVVYALVDRTEDYAALNEDLGILMAAHGALMVLGGVAFGYAVVRAQLLPRWTGIALIVGVASVAVTQAAPAAVQLTAAGIRATAFAGIGAALLMARRRALGTDRPHDPGRPPRPTGRELLAEVGDVLHDLPLFLTAPLYRRWHLHWGATPTEITATLPGDDLLPRAQYRSTRAITIDASPDAVWPWLVQVGCLRGGYYSNDLLDNLGQPSATSILPALQHLEVGQWVPMSPSQSPTDVTAFKVHSFKHQQWLLWSKPESTWTWQLTPTESGGTRLVTRIHATRDWRHPMMAILSVALMEFGDFAMLRRMLLGIKARAESLAEAGQATAGLA